MAHPVAFFEVVSSDHERAQRFYRDLFGWSVNADPEMGGYALVDTGTVDSAVQVPAIGGGIGPADEQNRPGVRIYVKVDDLDAFLARAEQLGGKQLMPPTPLPGDWGHCAVFADPDGNPVGLWA